MRKTSQSDFFSEVVLTYFYGKMQKVLSKEADYAK